MVRFHLGEHFLSCQNRKTSNKENQIERMDDLPTDCLIIIFTYLSRPDLLKGASNVCNEWRYLSMSPLLWHEYEWHRKDVSFVCSLCRQYGAWMRRLCLDSCPIITDSVLHHMVLHQMKELHELHLVNCSSITDLKIDVSGLDCELTAQEDVDQDKESVVPTLQPNNNRCNDVESVEEQKDVNYEEMSLLPVSHHMFTHLTSLSLVSTTVQTESIRSILITCRHTLQHLRLEYLSFKLSDVFTYKRTCASESARFIELPCLYSFTLGGYNNKRITSQEVDMLVNYTCPNLRHLGMRGLWIRLEKNNYYSHLFSGLKRWEQLQSLYIGQSTFKFALNERNFFQYLPHRLTELRIMNDPGWVNRSALNQHLEQCPDLRVIHSLKLVG